MLTLLRSPVLFPALSMLLSAGAAIGYLRVGEWSKAVYWILGGALTAVVTFGLKS